MNPASIMKLMSAKSQFERNHPKFVAFVKQVFSKPLEEGTILEITVTRPGAEPVTANIKVQQSDSTTGVTSAADGLCDIGMASRELKDEETALGIHSQKIAMDGIAVIVNNENPLEEIAAETVKGIYVGEITGWEEVQ